MNTEQWKNLMRDMGLSLALRYTPVEVKKIVDWMDRIKGSEERELIGSERVDAYLKFHEIPDGGVGFSKISDFVYDSMMARVWVYAPYILRQD